MGRAPFAQPGVFQESKGRLRTSGLGYWLRARIAAHAWASVQEMSVLTSIDSRMELFARQFGDLPEQATRLSDHEAREHRAFWIRRVLGKGLGSTYVIGYIHEDEWWTWCFEPVVSNTQLQPGLTQWRVERYDSSGRSATGLFCFDRVQLRWSRCVFNSCSGPSDADLEPC